MEQSETVSQFSWVSPLGISVLLFLISGTLHLLIGTLAPIMLDSRFGREILIISKRTDTAFFGIEPSQLLQKNPELAKLRTVMKGLSGWLAVVGMFIIAVTWFGLRQYQLWALITLGVTGATIVPFWYITFRPYVQAGISLGLSDLPPIFWIPAITLIPAVILGWIGLK